MNEFNQGVMRVLMEAYKRSFKTKSDFARAEAGWVAVCASSGWITTKWPDGNFSSHWRVTVEGLKHLEEMFK